MKMLRGLFIFVAITLVHTQTLLAECIVPDSPFPDCNTPPPPGAIVFSGSHCNYSIEMCDAIVAVGDILPNQTITNQMVKMEKRAKLTLSPGYFDDPQKVVGLCLNSTKNAGQPLNRFDMRECNKP